MTEPAAFDEAAHASRSENEVVSATSGVEVPADPVFADRAPTVEVPKAPVGPGMWEAMLWIIGFYAIEIIGGAIWVVGVLVYHSATGSPVNPMNLDDALEPVMAWMIGSCKFVEVVAALIAIRLRFGPDAFRLTGFRGVPAVHLGVLCFAILPTAIVSGQLYAFFKGYWDRLAEYAPFLEQFEKLSSIETVQAMAASTPLALLVLIIAVLPALNEEFVFRAAIGRGLVNRYGVIAGVALTSMLFAAMHMSPIHAAALVPLAVLIHVGYLSSRSIWWPVIVHFLNNAMSVVLMKLASQPPEKGGIPPELTESSFSPLLFTASIACVAATVWLLWTMRLKWRTEAGQVWEPNPVGVAAPPHSLETTAFVPSPPATALLAACLTYLLFPVALVVSIWLDRAA